MFKWNARSLTSLFSQWENLPGTNVKGTGWMPHSWFALLMASSQRSQCMHSNEFFRLPHLLESAQSSQVQRTVATHWPPTAASIRKVSVHASVLLGETLWGVTSTWLELGSFSPPNHHFWSGRNCVNIFYTLGFYLENCGFPSRNVMLLCTHRLL